VVVEMVAVVVNSVLRVAAEEAKAPAVVAVVVVVRVWWLA